MCCTIKSIDEFFTLELFIRRENFPCGILGNPVASIDKQPKLEDWQKTRLMNVCCAECLQQISQKISNWYPIEKKTNEHS